MHMDLCAVTLSQTTYLSSMIISVDCGHMVTVVTCSCLGTVPHMSHIYCDVNAMQVTHMSCLCICSNVMGIRALMWDNKSHVQALIPQNNCKCGTLFREYGPLGRFRAHLYEYMTKFVVMNFVSVSWRHHPLVHLLEGR